MIQEISRAKTKEAEWLTKATSIYLIRETTKSVYGVETGNYQRVKINFYSGECL
jgi:hypothetical protein